MMRTAETLTSENEELRAMRAGDLLTINSLTVQVAKLSERNDELTAQLEWFKRQVFGKKSERLVDMSGEQPLIPGLELPEPVEPEKVVVPAHTRRRDGGGKGENVLSIPDDLPRVDEVRDIPESEWFDPKTGKGLVEIGREVVEKLACAGPAYYVKRITYVKRAAPGDPLAGVVQPPAPPCVIEGSKFDPSFMADLVVEKYAYHMPLNRYQERMAAARIGVSRQTLSSLVVNLGQKVEPLVKRMKNRVLEQGVIFTDDTPVLMVREDGGGSAQGHMWVYLAGKPGSAPYHVYEFTEDWRHRHVIEALSGFEGVFHADAYEAHSKIDDKSETAVWAACWCHARRNFEDSMRCGCEAAFCLGILRMTRNLFRFERVAWASGPERRLEIRREKELKIVDAIFDKLRQRLISGPLLPKSKIAEAVNYMVAREKNFRVYLTNPDARMENNPAERALRKVVIGKKNWLFVGSKRAGESAAALMSLVQTCRAVDADPRDYLTDIFTRLLDYPAKLLDDLLPDNWLRRLGRKPKLTPTGGTDADGPPPDDDSKHP